MKKTEDVPELYYYNYSIIKKFNYNKRDWECLTHDKLPHDSTTQYFVEGQNFYNFGGEVSFKKSKDCWILHLQSGDMEQMIKMPTAREGQVVLHLRGEAKAFLIGGYYNKECLEFHI